MDVSAHEATLKALYDKKQVGFAVALLSVSLSYSLLLSLSLSVCVCAYYFIQSFCLLLQPDLIAIIISHPTACAR